MFCRDGYFKAVLSGVARAAEKTRCADQLKRPGLHEAQICDRGIEPRQHCQRSRPLECQQRVLWQGSDGAPVADARLQVREVVGLARGVDDQEQIILAPCHHQVVFDAALIVGEECVALLTNRKTRHIHRD